MKSIVIFVGLLAILAMVHAEDDAVEAPSSESDSEPAPPAEEPQSDESENERPHPHPQPHPNHHHHPHHEHGHPEGKPAKPNQVIGIGFHLDTGK